MPKLLHVLGGGAWRLPTIRRAQALGHRVLVTDLHADGPGYAVADRRELMDLTNLEGSLEVARRHAIQGVLADTSDIAVTTAAFIAERLGLPGIGMEAALNCTDKARMRACTRAAGLPAPDYCVLSRGDDLTAVRSRLGMPVVAKPVDNQSGRGVSIVRHARDLPAAVEAAFAHSRCGQVLLEGWVRGTEYIVDAFAHEGCWVVLGIAAKTQYAENRTLSARILYLDGADFEALHAVFEPAVRQVAAALELRAGLMHAEFVLGPDGVVPLDVAARGGGVLIYQTVLPHVSGVDAVSAATLQALGESPDAQPLPGSRRGACIEFIALPPGHLEAVEGLSEARALPGIAAVHLNVQPGQRIGAARNKDERPGFIVALADTSAQAQAFAGAAKARLHARMAGQREPAPVG